MDVQRRPEAGLGWLVGWREGEHFLFSSGPHSDFVILATAFPSFDLTPAVQCEKAQGAFGCLASGREGRPFLQREGPPPCLPWPSRFEPLALGRPGKHRPDPRPGRGRSCRQMGRRLARSPQTRGAGLTAGDNVSSGRLDALSGR